MSNIHLEVAAFLDFKALMENAAKIFLDAYGYRRDSSEETVEFEQDKDGNRHSYKVCIKAIRWGRCGDSDDHEYFYIPLELAYDKTEAIEAYARNQKATYDAEQLAIEQRQKELAANQRRAQFEALKKEFGDQ
jgi:hypothetical protein